MIVHKRLFGNCAKKAFFFGLYPSRNLETTGRKVVIPVWSISDGIERAAIDHLQGKGTVIMKRWVCVVAILVVPLLGGSLGKTLLADAGKPNELTKTEINQKIQHIQVPFIANKGQADE